MRVLSGKEKTKEERKHTHLATDSLKSEGAVVAGDAAHSVRTGFVEDHMRILGDKGLVTVSGRVGGYNNKKKKE